MHIIWDEEKNHWLQLYRSISLEKIADMLINGQYLDILENPSRDNQLYFVLPIHEYTWVVPFLVDAENRIILKTAFPSRKLHKKYGGNHE